MACSSPCIKLGVACMTSTPTCNRIYLFVSCVLLCVLMTFHSMFRLVQNQCNYVPCLYRQSLLCHCPYSYLRLFLLRWCRFLLGIQIGLLVFGLDGYSCYFRLKI